MQEAETRLVWNTFSSVMPYLVYQQDLRVLLEKLLGEGDDVEAFAKKFRQTISTQTDPTRKTDGQIFINELRHRLQK